MSKDKQPAVRKCPVCGTGVLRDVKYNDKVRASDGVDVVLTGFEASTCNSCKATPISAAQATRNYARVEAAKKAPSAPKQYNKEKEYAKTPQTYKAI